MKKYIVPVKHRVLEWKSFFETCFTDEESLNEAMQMLATTMTSLIMVSKSSDSKFNPFAYVLERCQELAETYQAVGQIPEDKTEGLAQHAYEFVTGLTAFLKDAGVLQFPSTIRFEGFVGLDIAISIDEISIDNLKEDVCQSG